MQDEREPLDRVKTFWRYKRGQKLRANGVVREQRLLWNSNESHEAIEVDSMVRVILVSGVAEALRSRWVERAEISMNVSGSLRNKESREMNVFGGECLACNLPDLTAVELDSLI